MIIKLILLSGYLHTLQRRCLQHVKRVTYAMQQMQRNCPYRIAHFRLLSALCMKIVYK